MQQKKSIHNDYFYISMAGIITIIVLSLVFSFYLYMTEKKQLLANLTEAAIQAENIINESFDYSSQLTRVIGSQIVEQGTDNGKIAKILSGKYVTNAIAKHIFSYTIFDWVTPNNQMIISGPYGIFSKPRDVSFKNYAKLAPKEPWKLHIDIPSYGIASGQYVLPAGMGITNNKGRLLGILTMGFSLSNLSKTVEQAIKDSRIKFIILSKDGTFLFQSNDTNVPNKDFKIKLFNFKGKSGKITNAIIYNDVNYSYYKKFEKYSVMILLGYNKSLLNNELYKNLIPRIAELFSIGLVSILLLFVIRKKIVSPLITLSSFADQISKGITKINIPKFYSFEMNILAAQLRKVVSYTDNLEQKVQARTVELEQALQAKTEFLNNMSHEIRTPMQGFDGIAQGLVENWQSLSENERFTYIKQIAKSSSRLSSLLGHLLDLSRFVAGKMILALKKVDLNLIITEMIDEVQILYSSEKQVFINYIPLQEALIIADKERIGQVLRNLFVNAIKFSPTNSKINISLKAHMITYDDKHESEAYHFAIKDEGIGIPENELESIFTPFVQSSRTKTRAGGTGLGLAIAREIIEAHHGKIWAENNEDYGTNFNFIIPVSQDKQMDGHKIIALNDTEVVQNSNVKTANILLIDDEDTCLMSMELLLFGSGYCLYKASGGYAGLEYLKAHYQNIDIIILDLMMPDIYGLNLLTEIKKNPYLAKIPIILQTGSSDTSEIDRAFKLGIFAYIKKPYQKNIIITEINKALHKR